MANRSLLQMEEQAKKQQHDGPSALRDDRENGVETADFGGIKLTGKKVLVEIFFFSNSYFSIAFELSKQRQPSDKSSN